MEPIFGSLGPGNPGVSVLARSQLKTGWEGVDKDRFLKS